MLCQGGQGARGSGPSPAAAEAHSEEAARIRRFPGIDFRGAGVARRARVVGAGLDVWEIVQLLANAGSAERLVRETRLTERQVRLAAAYCYSFPREVAAAIAQNNRIVDAWHEFHPFAELFATA
jgi:uncharacterized protein (DUF433 family)